MGGDVCLLKDQKYGSPKKEQNFQKVTYMIN